MTPGFGTNVGHIRSMKVGIVSIAAALGWASAAVAEEGFAGLADPTRPVSAAAHVYVAEPVAAGPVLQSTLIAPGVKRAVISGKTYVVGDHLGKAVVSNIRPYEVVLNQDGRETRLRLVPALEKQTAGTPPLSTGGQMRGMNP